MVAGGGGIGVAREPMNGRLPGCATRPTCDLVRGFAAASKFGAAA